MKWAAPHYVRQAAERLERESTPPPPEPPGDHDVDQERHAAACYCGWPGDDEPHRHVDRMRGARQ